MWRFAVFAFACSGCTNPDDILEIRGAVASVDPLEGQVVRLLRFIDTQDSALSETCSMAMPLKETSAAVAGAFNFEVFRVETRHASCFRVDANFASGSVAWTDFLPSSPETLLPRLLDWRASLRLDGGVLQFEPPIPWPDDALSRIQLTHRAQFVTGNGGIAWLADDRFRVADARSDFPSKEVYAREPLVLDDLRLEDFEGTLSLSAYLSDPDQENSLFAAGPIPTRLKAGDRLALRGARAPVSRGLGCPELGTPCPLTDGELTEVDAGMIDEISLTLNAPANLSAVVLRGAWVADDLIRVVIAQDDGGIGGSFEGALRIGEDRSDFLFGGPPFVQVRDGGFATLQIVYMVIPLDAGTLSSRVTLQFPAGLARIREVSLFGP